MGDKRFEFDALVTATFAVFAPTLLDAAAKVRAVQEEDPARLDEDVVLRAISWGNQVGAELKLLVDGGMGDPVILDRMSDPATRPPDIDPEELLGEASRYLLAVQRTDATEQINALRALVNLALARWPEVAERVLGGRI
ncbi:hypothetical protein [Micromonospora maritima]|uniref:hypothetical protein n=1 Tax=Micromonospora maritima TaxID=986711 RepID=UPI00157CF220|nr:hypothetical protein [Micromonospora maritima]